MSSHRRRRRRAVDGEQLLAPGARRAEAERAKEDGVGRTAVVLVGVVASPPAVAELSALELHEGLADVVEALARAVFERHRRRAARGAYNLLIRRRTALRVMLPMTKRHSSPVLSDLAFLAWPFFTTESGYQRDKVLTICINL